MENNLAVLIPKSTKYENIYFCAEKCKDYIKVGYIKGESDFTKEEENTLSSYLSSMEGADLSPAYFRESNFMFRTVKNSTDTLKITTSGNGSYYIFSPFEVIKGGTKEFYDYVCNNK